MSGIEIAGLVLGTVPFLVSSLEKYGRFSRVIADKRAEYGTRINEHGLVVTFFLHILFSDALFVIDRVERYVLHADDQYVIAFMKSYTSSFNMIGIAGAIIAQVAISAISLTGLEYSHWAAEGFFVVSLVAGCLSVFFSCAISPAFHGLHSAEDIKDFLTKPSPSANAKNFNWIVSEVRRHKNELNDFSEVEINNLRKHIETERWKVASAYAAIMLVVPMTLLKIALNAFLIGLGIYLGKLYTAKLVPSFGSRSIGILIFYLVSALFGIGIYYVAQSLKYLENTPLRHWRNILHDHTVNKTRNEQVGEDAPSEDGCATPTPNPGHFRQSRHVREGNRVRFTTEDETVRHAADPGRLHLAKIPRTSTEDDSLPFNEERASPGPRVAFNTSGSSEATATAGLDLVHVQDILKELIRAQEESLLANRRLLEAFNTVD